MEAPRYIVNVEAAVCDGPRYLMIVRGQTVPSVAGTLVPPGGKVEVSGLVDEVLEQTARREVLEEVGIEVGEEIAYVESHAFELEGTPVIDVVMLCRYRSGDPRVASPAEVVSVSWMTLDEIVSDERAMPWTRRSMEMAEAVRLARGW
jgi:8-oxo-dGTP diphosphatase